MEHTIKESGFSTGLRGEGNLHMLQATSMRDFGTETKLVDKGFT